MSPIRYIRTVVFRVRQEDMAVIGGVSRPAISRYETGRDNPSYPFLKRIRDAARARGLTFDSDWFFAAPPIEHIRAREDVQ